MKKLMKFLVRKVPRKHLIRFSFIFRPILSVLYKGKKYECPICGGKFRKFLPFGNSGEANRLCPGCLSLERHRLLWLYFQNKTGIFTEKLKVMHVAPEQPYYKRFRKASNIEYITADLESPIADVKMDLHDIPFDENTFDVVICNHVLEH
ncbi:MAG: methyltransferase domain-containing protein, partial [Bacteroidetes bacterium]|nr:methyltransferase domain-containing protein [Bacteroidota bacterium]